MKSDKKGLIDYFLKNIQSTDIFCLQECDRPSQDIISSILSEYSLVSTNKVIGNSDRYWLCTYVKNNYRIENNTNITGGRKNLVPALECSVGFENTLISIVNCHGNCMPSEKKDTEERMDYSTNILDYLDNIKSAAIVGGDFNLLKNTKSIKMFSKKGLKNLIEEYNIETTRNKLAWDLYPVKYLDSDYVFVSNGVKVIEFDVPYYEISDHLPLEIEFELI